MNEDPCSGRGISLSHNVLDVLFHCLFRNLKGVSDFFVSPPFCQMFNDGLFPIGQLKPFPGLICIELLSPR